MTAEQRERVKELFGAAMEMPPAEGDAFVAAAEEDGSVRDEVLQLLKEHRDSGSFLKTRSLAEPEKNRNGAARRRFQDGQIVEDRYRIERFLKAGGMGEVYEAYDEKLEQRVALKTILPVFAGDRRLMSRFKREIALARRVTHPNVCRVFDLGEHHDTETGEDFAFLTMELLRGETLGDRLKREGRFEPGEALPLIHQMAEALTAAHKAGVIHRDFKPGNVLLVPEANERERVVVSDFGLARTVERETGVHSLSATGHVIGTPDYMAPEQLTGGEVGPPTDVYALGIVIYEMVTGKKPFAGGEALENAVQRVTSPPTPPREHVPDLDERWVRTIERCLEKEPTARPQSPLEVLAGLEGDEDALAPAGESQRPTGFWDGRLARLMLTAIAILAGIISLLGWQSGWFDSLPDDKHLAVLPLSVGGGDEITATFVDGLTDGITEGLSRLEQFNKNLWVVPAGKVREDDLSTVAGARAGYGVNLVVTGKVHANTHAYRLDLEVWDAERDVRIDSRSVAVPRTEVTRLRATVVEELAELLELEPEPQALAEFAAEENVLPEAYKQYQEGLGFLRRPGVSNLGKAIERFRAAIGSDATYALAFARLAEAYWRRFDVSKQAADVELAKNNLRRAAELNPNLAEVHITNGSIERNQGSPTEAVKEFKRALELDPVDEEALNGLALTYTRMGEVKLAEQAYKEAIRLRPDYWAGYNDLGAFYVDHGRIEEALPMFEAVTRLIPASAAGYANLGGALLYAGRLDEAEAALKTAIEVEPSAEAYSNLGICAFTRGAYREAVDYQLKSLQQNPRNHTAWRNLGDYYLLIPQLSPKAKDAYREAADVAEREFEVRPADPDLAVAIAVYYAKLREKETALGYLKNSFELAPPDVIRRYQTAVVYELLSDREAALRQLTIAIEGGFPITQVAADPDLANLVKDPRFDRRVGGASPELASESMG